MENTTLLGFSALVAALLELAKKFGWLPDNLGGKVAVVANALLLAAGLATKQLGLDLSSYDAIAATVSQLVIQLVALTTTSFFVHKGLKTLKLGGR